MHVERSAIQSSPLLGDALGELNRRAALAEKATSSAALRVLEDSPRPSTYIPDPEFRCSGAGPIANFNKNQILGESKDTRCFPF